jgi:hypothetical protein
MLQEIKTNKKRMQKRGFLFYFIFAELVKQSKIIGC